MKEHPILFKGDMVRAIINGRKIQTRRIVTPRNSTVNEYPSSKLWNHLHHWEFAWVDSLSDLIGGGDGYHCLHVPAWNPLYGDIPGPMNEREWMWYCVRPKLDPGDRLWVKETWWSLHPKDPSSLNRGEVAYRATDIAPPEVEIKWKPSIFMPRWASRITLEITNIRCERVQDISEEDAIAEGCEGVVCDHMSIGDCGGRLACTDCMNTGWIEPPTLQFQQLWDSIDRKQGWGWDKNPWVWVYDFKIIQSILTNLNTMIQ